MALDHSSSGITSPQISRFLPLDLLDVGRNGCAATLRNGNLALDSIDGTYGSHTAHKSYFRSLFFVFRSPSIAMLQPSTRHPLSHSAFFHEILFQSANLLIQQVIGLMNQADRNVRNNFSGP